MAIISHDSHVMLDLSLQDPSIDSVTPNTGPKAGGILVTIRGSNLDVGSSLSVWLVNIPCDIIK